MPNIASIENEDLDALQTDDNFSDWLCCELKYWFNWTGSDVIWDLAFRKEVALWPDANILS